MSDWSHKGLWAKAQLYAGRAAEEETYNPLYPLWSTLALEFIGRSLLAKINMALLADATSDDNILHACGFPVGTVPRSIAANKVFKRCKLLIKEFTTADFEIAMGLIERRNAELHSGTSGFEGYGTEKWLADYFRICRLLLEAQEKTLADLFGEEQAVAAQKMISAAEERVLGTVKKAIFEAKRRFEALDDPAREACQKAAATQLKVLKVKQVNCPACGCKAIVRGERVSLKKTQVDDTTGTLYRRAIILPTSLECLCCKLSLKGHAALHAAGMGGNYEAVEEIDPAEYFGIEQPSEAAMQAYAEEYMRELAEDAMSNYEEE